MLSCDYTSNTNYTFDVNLCENCECYNNNDSCCNINDRKFNTCGVVPDKWVQLFIPYIKDIPEEKPSIEGIVSANTSVEIISQRVIKTPVVQGYTLPDGTVVPGSEIPNAECTFLTGRKLILEGIIKQTIVYTALLEDQALHSATFKIPFSAFIIIDGTTPLSQKFRVRPVVEDVFACKLSERSVFSNTTLFIQAAPVC